MDNDRIVYEALSATGVPGARLTWGPQPPQCPYFTYFQRPWSLFADNEGIREPNRYRVELHMAEDDEDVLEGFSHAVSSLGPTKLHQVTVNDDGQRLYRFDFTLIGR